MAIKKFISITRILFAAIIFMITSNIFAQVAANVWINGTPTGAHIAPASASISYGINVGGTITMQVNGSTVSSFSKSSSGQYSYTFSGLPAGTHSLSVTLTAPWGSSDSDSRSYIVNAPSLTVSPTSLSPGYSSGSSSISVSSNISWAASSNSSWISVSPSSGTGNGSFTLSYTANSSTSSRSGSVTVSGGGISRTVSVTQAGAPPPPPTVTLVSVTPSSATAPASVTLYYSINQSGTVFRSIDGGNTSTTGHSPGTYSYTFTGVSPGTHTLTVTVSNSNGSDTESTSYTVNNALPSASISSISPGSAVQGTNISFSGTGSDPDGGTIQAFSWRSNINGSLSSSASFNTSSLSVGSHTIYFKVQDNEGAWSSEVSSSLIINSPPPIVYLITIDPGSGTQSAPASTTLYYSVDQGSTINFYLDGVNDGGTGVNAGTYSHTFSNLSIGSHTLRVDASNSNGSDSKSTSYTVNNAVPTASINVISPNSPVQYGTNITFIGSGSDPDGGALIGYNWRSSIDGTLNTTSSFNTNTLSVGTHTIYFKVQDNEGAWSSEVSSSLIINPLPPVLNSIFASPSSTATPENGVTINIASYSGSPTHLMLSESPTFSGSNWQSFSTSKTYTINYYQGPGTYTVYCKLKNSGGESAVKSCQIEYLPQPPSAPSSVNAIALSETSVRLTWGNVSIEDGYKIFRSLNQNFGFEQVGNVGTNILEFTDNNLTTNTTYYYYVSAYNTGGSSSSNTVSVITSLPPTVTINNIEPNSGTSPAPDDIILTVSSNEGGSIQWYLNDVVYGGTGQGSPINNQSIIFEDIVAGTHEFRVEVTSNITGLTGTGVLSNYVVNKKLQIVSVNPPSPSNTQTDVSIEYKANFGGNHYFYDNGVLVSGSGNNAGTFTYTYQGLNPGPHILEIKVGELIDSVIYVVNDNLTIEGSVKDKNNAPVEDVIVSFYENNILIYTTNSLSVDGSYEIRIPRGTSGTIKLVKDGYAFTPQLREYENIQTNISNEDYIAIDLVINKYDFEYTATMTTALNYNGLPYNFTSAEIFAFSGEELRGSTNYSEIKPDGTVVYFMTLYLRTFTEDIDFRVSIPESGSLIPVDGQMSISNDDIIGTASLPYVTQFQDIFYVSGSIVNNFNIPVKGATIKLISNENGIDILDNELVIQTDENGKFNIPVNLNWSGKIIPFSPSYSFKPDSLNLNQVTCNLDNNVFIAKSNQTQEFEKGLSGEFILSQNYPNPFNPATQITYSIKDNSFVSIKVYNVLGKEITTLVNENKEAGVYSISFEGYNLPSGIYFYRITAGHFSETKKMILAK